MLTPSEFIDNYAAIGERKVKAPALNLFLSGIMAGFFIGMGGLVTNVVSNSITNPSVAKILCGLLFPFGLIMVMLTGAELFTGNCLITISLLEKRVSFAGMLRNLVIVYVGNFAGAVLLAYAYIHTGAISLSLNATLKVAAAKSSMSFGSAVILGILCNILVCTAVMMGLCAKSVTGRAAGAYFPVAFFVIAGFEHCVANMYYVPVGIFANVDNPALTWGNFLVNNLLPVTLGNIIGGCILSLLLWQIHRRREN